jgi:MOSC domain-containing protein YiiM
VVSSSRTGVIVSLNRSNGGVPKLAVSEARITHAGMEGDRQRNLKHHGGPDRALCLYSADLIESLRSEGHAIEPGSLGENVTIAGIDWGLLEPGIRADLGEVSVEITSYAMPCRNVAPVFADGRSGRVSQRTHPGESRLYARVLREGMLRVSDRVVVR